MPVVIKDFEVVGNGNGSQEAASGVRPVQEGERPSPSGLPTNGRQFAQMMKFVKERAKRLHAD